jgi:hypothetical protein
MGTYICRNCMSAAFPMARAGGLFILIMGVGVILGGRFPGHRKLLLALGGVAATLAVVLFANELNGPIGLPTSGQVRALYGAMLFEVLLIGVVVARYKHAGDRTLLLAILVVVGFHFIPMAIAFGPLCAALGISVLINAGAGLWVKRDVPLNYFWVIDGALKIACGGVMFFWRATRVA